MMKNISAITLLLLLSTTSCFAQSYFKDSTKFKKIGVGVDVFKMVTFLNQFTNGINKTSKMDLALKYKVGKYFLATSNLGAVSIHRYSDKYNYTYRTKGSYLQLGGALALRLDNQTDFLMGYSFGLTNFKIQDNFVVKNDFWNDSIEIKLPPITGIKTYHELYMSVYNELYSNERCAFYIEPAVRLRFGLSGIKEEDDRNRYPGFGQTTYPASLFLAFSWHIGLKF